MAITFSSTSGTSGVTNIEVTATERLENTNYSKNYVISNDDMSLGMTVAQKAYVPTEKYITLSPSAISWTSSESTDSITVNSNDDWVVLSDGWIELSRMYSTKDHSERVNVVSGNGNTIIGIRCSENTGSTRTGGITAYCQSDSSITATTTVSQAGGYEKPYIMLGYYSLEVVGNGVSTAVSVTSNVSWSAITDSRWITINTLTGTGNGSVSFIVDANTADIERRGTITVFNGELIDVLVVSQEASSSKPYIELSPTSFSVPSTGSTGNVISVSANCDYNITTDVNWITLSASSGSGNGSVSFATSSTADKSANVGNIEFSNADISRTVSVERQGVGHYLSASTNSISTSSSGGSIEVYVYSNVNWSVSVDMGESELTDNWITVSPSSGSNDGSIRISVGSGYTAASGSVVLSSTKYGLSWVVDVNRREPVDGTKIFYTTTGGTVLNPNYTSGWGANIVSNTYENGIGIIQFDGDVTSVPNGAFNDSWPYFSTLETITIPDTVTSIGQAAFAGNQNLVSCNIPYEITEITNGLFADCPSLTSITIPNSVVYISENAFANAGIESITIPNSVTGIGWNAFMECNGLTSISIPNSVVSIGGGLFLSCTSLTNATVGSGLTVLDSTFAACTSLVNVSLSNTISVLDGTFDGCSSLTRINIPRSVTVITSSFYYCSALTSIYSYATTAPTINEYTFNNVSETGTLHYPSGSNYSSWISELPSGWTAVADL